MDRLRLVMPPVLFFTLSFPFTRLAYILFPTAMANGIIAGSFAFYVLYDCMHYALHHTKLPQYLADMKKYHLAHHYKNFELGFGVTSKVWDYVFNTVLPVHRRPYFNLLSPGDWSLALSPLIFLVITSKLAIQQPKDITIRLLILPLGLYLCAYAATFRDYGVGGPQYNPWNYGVGVTSFALAMKMAHMTFTRTVPERIVEFPPVRHVGVAAAAYTTPNGSGSNSPDVEGLKTEPLKGSFMEIVAYIFDPRHLR
ncbi:fatty acid alpha-hydroxylase, partial [Tulasnella sp. 427]